MNRGYSRGYAKGYDDGYQVAEHQAIGIRREGIQQYLASLKTVVWGRVFEIHKEPEPAISFIVELLEALGIEVDDE